MMANEDSFADEIRGPEPKPTNIVVAVAVGAVATAVIAILFARGARK